MRQIPSNYRKIISLMGPWPIEPLYLGALTFFMVASLYSIGDNASSNLVTIDAIIRPIFSFAIAIATYVQLRVMKRLTPDYLKSLPKYLLLLVIQSFSIWSLVVLLRNLFPSIHSSLTAFLSPVPVVRFLFTLLCINAFIGLSRSRLEQALAEKEDTLKILEEQSNLLLEHDESTRIQLSEFLHDRVQSSLVTACLELQQIKSDLPKNEQDGITRIINALEDLRAVDVRNAAQTLSPAVGNADIATSISVMTKNYAPHVIVSLEISNDIEILQGEENKELFLGIYRIIEQSFLNSIIHGKATRFAITLNLDAEGVELKASNNGAKIPPKIEPGLGSAIINAWIRTLGGTWVLSNNSAGEVELNARFPRH